jgi:hypothetical protein
VALVDGPKGSIAGFRSALPALDRAVASAPVLASSAD